MKTFTEVLLPSVGYRFALAPEIQLSLCPRSSTSLDSAELWPLIASLSQSLLYRQPCPHLPRRPPVLDRKQSRTASRSCRNASRLPLLPLPPLTFVSKILMMCFPQPRVSEELVQKFPQRSFTSLREPPRFSASPDLYSVPIHRRFSACPSLNQQKRWTGCWVCGGGSWDHFERLSLLMFLLFRHLL